MQITSNLTTNVSSNFNSELNDEVKSLANKQTSTDSDTNSEISENQAQSSQPFKYQQYNSLESNYFKSLLNSALPKKSTHIKEENNKGTNVETTKVTNEPTR